MKANSKHIIVVVDEDLELHEHISAFFKPKGFSVICYDNATLAIEESQNFGSTWDVMLTDYHFPYMLATEFTKAIKTNLPQLPIILISPIEHTDTTQKVVKYAGYDSVSKPIHFGQLQVAVDRALKMRAIALESHDHDDEMISIPTQVGSLIGRSPKFLTAIDLARRVAKSSASILLSGESETGKEVFANFIHNNSKQSAGPFTAINCSSIPEALLESELFGHAKGSFTGAIDKRVGLFEAAEDGTLFLDEVGDLGLPLQAKLLRVLQERKIKRVGENKDISINCRIISATHKDLAQEIKDGKFREDLFFRLNVIPITIPALRDRPEDILPLANTFLRKFAAINDSAAKAFATESVQFILENKWQGNVRELENTIERAVILCTGPEVMLENFIPASDIVMNVDENQPTPPPPPEENMFCIRYETHLPKLDDVINKYITYAVIKNGGARDKTAREIGIDRKTLYRRMQF